MKHGDYKTRFYCTWKKMLQRCKNPNDTSYKNYGQKGIIVCDRWLKYENFKADMFENYTDKLTIERIDFNKGYFKENCKWATYAEQSRNRRNNHLVDSPWGLLTITDVAQKIGIHRTVLLYRINKKWGKERLFKEKDKKLL